MKIEKRINDYNNFDITITDDEKMLTIYQVGMDETIACRYINITGELSHITFDIPYYSDIYPLFNKLYESLINADILGLGMISEQQELYKSYTSYKNLVNDEVITFHSDNYPLTCPNTLSIIKHEGKIELVFDKVIDKYQVPKFPFDISIHIRQSGSRYEPFNIPFKNLYKDLQGLEDTKAKTLKK